MRMYAVYSAVAPHMYVMLTHVMAYYMHMHMLPASDRSFLDLREIITNVAHCNPVYNCR